MRENGCEPEAVSSTSLTDEELRFLESATSYAALYIEHKAAAEIRELRGDNAKLCNWKIKYGRHIKNIEAANARLRAALVKYGMHNHPCAWHTSQRDDVCDCGFHDALAGKEPADE